MNNNHLPTPEELDAFLAARQRGEQPEPTVASNSEILSLADHIQTLTDAAQPDPQFVAALEVRLKQAASQQQARPASSRPASKERKFPMSRRFVFAFAGIAGVAAMVLIALLFTLPRLQTQQPVAMQTQQVVALALLPGLGGAGPTGKGGGGSAPEAMNASAGMVADGGFIAETPNFSGTQFILQTELPGLTGPRTVYRQPEATPLTLDEFRQLAARFGLQGPVYTEQYAIMYGAAEAAPDAAGKMVASDVANYYLIFDGMRQVGGGYSNGVTYTDRSVLPISQNSDLLPFEQQKAAAEAFLNQRGLLDFPYRVVADPYWPAGVGFYRLVGDYALEFSEIEVQFGQGGQIQSVNYHPLPLETIADYPLRSAQSAWDTLLANQLTWDQLSFWTYSPITDIFTYQSWQPQYHAGETIEKIGYITVYQPAEGEQASLRLMLSDLLLSASEADLQTLSGLASAQLKIWGQVRQDESGALVLDVAGWEESSEYSQYYTGSITRQGDGMLFLRSDGLSFYLAHIPATLPDGIAIDITGFETARQENGLPVFEWDYIQTPPSEQSTDVTAKEGVVSGEGMSAGSTGIDASVASWNPPDWQSGGTFTALEGQLFAYVYENADGSLSYSFSLSEMPLKGDGWSLSINTTDPASLAALDRQWVRVSGRYQEAEWPVADIDSFVAVDSSRPVQAWLGTVAVENLEGQDVAVLTTRDQQRFVLASTVRWLESYSMYIYQSGHQFVFEGILRPETFGGLPLIEEVTWNTSEEIDAYTDISQYTLTPRPDVSEYIPPAPLLPGKATVEQVELAYTITYAYDEATQTSMQYIQPIWRFSGSTEDGTRFVIMVQAVDPAYLK